MIDHYLDTILRPFLRERSVADASAEAVIADVQKRLIALRRRWAHREQRATLLLPGVEEATFYAPDNVPLSNRALVVCGIRNSRLADLHAVGQIDDPQMRQLMEKSASFFWRSNTVQLLAASSRLLSDPFVGLSQTYPAAWRALSQLAALPEGEQETRFTLTPSAAPMTSGLPLALAPDSPIFFADSFKTLTRNLDKLYRALEVLLARDQAFCSHNYYIAKGYVARRTALLRPARTARDAASKFRDQGGLTETHQQALRVARQQFFQPPSP